MGAGRWQHALRFAADPASADDVRLRAPGETVRKPALRDADVRLRHRYPRRSKPWRLPTQPSERCNDRSAEDLTQAQFGERIGASLIGLGPFGEPAARLGSEYRWQAAGWCGESGAQRVSSADVRNTE